MLDFVIFGFIDNAVMLAGALAGISIEKKLPKRFQTGFLGVTLGAGIGNAFSDFLGGLGATNLELAFGSGLGCLLALFIIPFYVQLNKKVNQ